MPLLQIIYASTSGHTEYVVDTLIEYLKTELSSWKWKITKLKAEQANPEDLLSGDVLLLASSTWNTGSIEGQLNPHMWVLCNDKAKDIDLKGKKCACIGLGDHRYFYTCRAAEHLENFVKDHKGNLITPVLKIINEPYDQEEAVKFWGKQLIASLK